MYPNQPQQPYTPPPVDYLSQIAPQGPQKAPFQFGIKPLIMIGVGLVVAMIIIVVIVNTIVASRREPLEQLSARLGATAPVVTDAQGNLKSSKLRSLNSNLKLYMTNTTRDITKPLTAAGIDIPKISKDVIAKESTTALSARLEDARLNAVFDRTYAREMAFQLDSLLMLMSKIYDSTSSQELKTFVKSAYENLEPTQDGFESFTATE